MSFFQNTRLGDSTEILWVIFLGLLCAIDTMGKGSKGKEMLAISRKSQIQNLKSQI